MADAALQDGLQPSAPPDAPASESGINGAVTGTAVLAPGPRDRDAKTGRFVRHNLAALKTGDRSASFWRAIEALHAERVEQLRRDLGLDRLHVPAAVARLVEVQVECGLKRQHHWRFLAESDGPLTKDGRTRSASRLHDEQGDREARHLRDLVTLISAFTDHREPGGPTLADVMREDGRR